MNPDIREILDKSTASDAVKIQALTIGMEVCGKIALNATQNQAGGQFLLLLMELLKMFLPILLEMLMPKV